MDSKELVARREPPGDNWSLINENDIIYGSLTDCLNAIFNVKKVSQFFIDAKKGEVYIEGDGVETKKEIKKYSLYGEDI
tara:strand:- start:781 stop:1017 length:237 start_codon:yes stop_codon:yes gene_type:complete